MWARTPAPTQLLHQSQKRSIPTRPDLDVPALDLDVTPAPIEQDLAGRADHDVGRRALQVNRLQSRQREGIALCLHVHVAAGGVQLDANILHGALAVFGFAACEQADAVFHGPGRMALAQEVGILACRDGGVLASGHHRVRGRGAADVGRGAEHDVRPLGHGDAAVAAIHGLQCTLACIRMAAAAIGRLRAFQAGQRGLYGLLGVELVGGGFVGQIGFVGAGVVAQGFDQLGVALQLALCFARVGGLALGAAGAASPRMGADVQTAACAQGALGLGVQLQAVAALGQALVVVLL